MRTTASAPSDVAAPSVHRSLPVLGWAALGVAAACLLTTAVLGPSAAEPLLGAGDTGTTPPWHAEAAPPAGMVSLLLAVAVVVGAIAVALVISGRWRPRPARLLVVGGLVAAALALVPPVGSADPLSYASYGRMVVTGHDPYTTTPAELAPTDRVAAAVELPWQHEPSVYGPLATAEQSLAAAVAGEDAARIVLVLDLLGLLAFLGAGWALLRAAGTEQGRLRAAALWTANPLLWLQVVAGGHLDVVLAAAAVSAVLVARRRQVAGAALTGVAALIKPTGGLVWFAVAWPSRRDPRRLAVLAAVTAAVVVAGYAFTGTGALHQLARAGRRVSRATPWRPILDWTHAPRGLIGALALLLAIGLAVLLARDRLGTTPALVAVAATTAYVLAAPYALPWYDALAWVMLPLIVASWRDWLLLAHTTVLSLAYLPGRDAVQLHGSLHAVTSGMRSVAAPIALTLLVVVVALRARRAVR